MNDIDLLKQVLGPSDADAAAWMSEGTRIDLRARIVATPVPANVRARQPLAAARAGMRRRWYLGIPVAIGLSGFLLVGGVLGGPAAPGGAGTAKAAVTVTRHGKFLDLVVRDPKAVLADVQKYEIEVKRLGLNVIFGAQPAPPPLVGKLLALGYSQGAKHAVKQIGHEGVRIPVGFKGYLQLEFGGPGQPGHVYGWMEDATKRGEPLAGLTITGKTVSELMPLLKQRAVTATYTLAKKVHFTKVTLPSGTIVWTTNQRGSVRADRVPGSYFVYQALTWAPGEVMLTVGATPTMPQPPGGTR